jgi:hypothetical protein
MLVQMLMLTVFVHMVGVIEMQQHVIMVHPMLEVLSLDAPTKMVQKVKAHD